MSKHGQPADELGISEKVASLAALNRAVWDRRLEYTTRKTIRIKIGTWNVAAISGTEKDVAGWFIKGKGVAKDLAGFNAPGNAEDIVEHEAGESKTSQDVQREHDSDSAVKENDGGKTQSGAIQSPRDIESVQNQEARRTPNRSTLPLGDPQLIPGDGDIGLYVLGLQEIVDVTSVAEALRPYHDRAPGERWKSAILAALPTGYSVVGEQQLIGMYIVIYASPELGPTISNVSCKFVGTGLGGYMGNKGAVAVRIVLDEMTKVAFINCHLAAGAQAQSVARRNWDAEQVVTRLRFSEINRGHGVIDEVGDCLGDEDFAFWFGDLNYRLAELPGDDIRRLLMRHTERAYRQDAAVHNSQDPKIDAASSQVSDQHTDADDDDDEDQLSPEEDPASMYTTLSSLLPHDELGEQMRERKAFHEGWREGKIRFLPTYKYDVGSMGVFDSSEKQRAPSWCDRILYRTRRDYLQYKDSQGSGNKLTISSATQSRSSDEGSSLDGTSSDPTAHDQTSHDLDEYDPDNDAYDPDAEDPLNDIPAEQDDVELDYYTSHQRVLSSDHKPLNAVFRLTYRAVDSEKKAAIHHEVARDFDRLENEARPTLSVAVDTSEGKSTHELIDFGRVHFGQEVSRTITLANTGQVDAHFRLINMNHNGHSRPWLKLHCDHPLEKDNLTYRITPGDAWPVAITFSVLDPAVARNISAQLEDVLILRIDGGRDHFLTLRAEWEKTTLGMSIDELIRLPESGVRSESDDDDVKCSAPRELFRLTEALEGSLERAVAEWGMKGPAGTEPPWNGPWPFSSQPKSELMTRVQELLDTNQALNLDLDSVQRTEVYATVLVRFLDSLADGVVDAGLWSIMREDMVVFDKIKQPTANDVSTQSVKISEVLSRSTPHNVSFQLLISMLRRISGEIAASHADGNAVNDAQLVQTKESIKHSYAEFFQNIIFRPRFGQDGNLGKDANRNVTRRIAILEMCLSDASPA